VDPNFRILDLEEDESKEKLPTKARRKNLPLKLGAHSQGAHANMDDNPNLMHLIGETSHPQPNESKL
jgi:hypothetical protein